MKKATLPFLPVIHFPSWSTSRAEEGQAALPFLPLIRAGGMGDWVVKERVTSGGDDSAEVGGVDVRVPGNKV
jgi:hypothetical protein